MNSLDSGAVSPTAARIYGAAAIVAPILLLASTVTYITAGDGINDGVLGGTIGVWSCFALAIAFVGLLRLLEPAAPKAAPILTIVALTGFAAGVAFNVQAIFTAYFGPQIDDFMDTVDGSDAIAVLAFLPWGWFAPVTFAATGIVLWRTRSTTRWSAGLLVAAGVLFIASRPARIDPLAVISDVVLILALAPIGWSIVTRRTTSALAPSPATT
ncbi:MAG: hypothetical protein ACRD0G_03970 [Acidimicrobiales bacterium]